MELRRRLESLLAKNHPYFYLDTEENLKDLARLELLANQSAPPVANLMTPNDPARCRAALETLAKGPPGARLTEEARAALERVRKKSAKK